MGAPQKQEIKPTNDGYIDNFMQAFLAQSLNPEQENEAADDEFWNGIEAQANQVLKQILSDSNNDVNLALAKCEAAFVRLIVLTSKVANIISERYVKAPLLTKEERDQFEVLKTQLVASGIYSKDTLDQFNVLTTTLKESLRPMFEACLQDMKQKPKTVAKPRP